MTAIPLEHPAKHPLLATWRREKVIAVIRATTASEALAQVAQVRALGISCVEITLTFADAFAVIEQISPPFGCGTVLSVAQAQAALHHGAQFLVSPLTNPDLIRLGKQAGALVVSGAWTATEINLAHHSGADVIKLFPANVGGAAYLRNLRQIFPEVTFLPCGGVTVDTVEDFLGAGALAVGLGRELGRVTAQQADQWRRFSSLAR